LPIAFVMASFEPGGTERQMTELIRRLDPARWTVHVATFRPEGAWFGRVAEAAASVATFPVTTFKSPAGLAQLWRFAQWCRERGIVVVHTAELYSNIFGLPGAALARVPVRVGNRRELNPDKSVAQIATQRAAYACAHKIVANSRAAVEQLIQERVPAHRIALVPNGLDCDRFHARARQRALRRVVVVANLRAEKGHDVLIDASVSVLREFPDARFEFVGAGPERDRLQARARERGVSHAITFAGHCDDVPARLAAADLFVLPSRSEAFPNALLEAMAAGLPVVASSVGGMLELVEHERTGLLAPPGDPSALAHQMTRLMSAPAFADALGAAAREKVVSQYSFDRMVDSFERLYLTELSRRVARVKARAPRGFAERLEREA
jgi:glycosyltransferase involved in cell wall biosynthesis